MRLVCHTSWFWGLLPFMWVLSCKADLDVYIPDVPDYKWYAGCTGTGIGIIMGYWDRHGFPNLYTGPTSGGVAPLDNVDTNFGISAMWATRAELDGRPLDKPGHIDDYWTFYSLANEWPFSYESTEEDPYKIAGRREHLPDCVGDFIGLSQKKWTNMNDECDGNIDSYAFVFWDKSGEKRVNYQPPFKAGSQPRDVPSGWRTWTRYRGYNANVFSQLTDFNTNVPPGKGFTFGDLKAEINAGYPLLLYQQPFAENVSKPDKRHPDAWQPRDTCGGCVWLLRSRRRISVGSLPLCLGEWR